MPSREQVRVDGNRQTFNLSVGWDKSPVPQRTSGSNQWSNHRDAPPRERGHRRPAILWRVRWQSPGKLDRQAIERGGRFKGRLERPPEEPRFELMAFRLAVQIGTAPPGWGCHPGGLAEGMLGFWAYGGARDGWEGRDVGMMDVEDVGKADLGRYG